MKYHEITSEIYTFKWSESMGFLKRIENFKIKQNLNKFYFVPIRGKYEIEDATELTQINKPFDGNEKWSFIFIGLLFPILFSFLFMILSMYTMVKSPEYMQIILGIIFLFVMGDIFFFFKKLQNYKNGVSAFTKHDFLKTFLLFLVVLLYAVFVFNISEGGLEKISTAFFIFLCYFSFIEGIKKPILIILSDNIQYWKYIGNNKNANFLAISIKLTEDKVNEKE